MSDSGKLDSSGLSNVKVDGEDAVLHITDQSVMFEKHSQVTGFLRSAIQLVKPEGNAMIIAYSAGSEVKSVRVEPLTAVASLLVPSSTSRVVSGQIQTSGLVLKEVFEKLYWDTRKELEERLSKVQEEPENKSLRLSSDEEKKYRQVWKQMRSVVGAKYGFDPSAPGSSLRFLDLDKEPYNRQLDTIKTMHIAFLHDLVSPRAEIADIGYTIEDVWPDDWERILVRFRLSTGPFLSEKFKNYLKTKWTHRRGKRTPVLAQP